LLMSTKTVSIELRCVREVPRMAGERRDRAPTGEGALSGRPTALG
jgi:hypothetical protein